MARCSGQYMEMGGVDEGGGNVDTCRLVGSYQLTSYIDDEEFARYQAHYPELNIMQPPYTVIEFDDSVPDDAHVSNLDNETGYKYGNAYQPSGHIKHISPSVIVSSPRSPGRPRRSTQDGWHRHRDEQARR